MFREAGAVDNRPREVFANPRTREVNKEQARRTRVQFTSVEKRLADMDLMGIDVQAITPAPNQTYYDTPPDLGIATARVINDNIAEICARHPDRFAGLGTVPFQAPDLAVAELERLHESLGLRGIEIATNVAGADLSEDRFRKIFAKAEELNLTLFMHPTGFTEARRFGDHYFTNVIGNPLDTTVAVHHLIFGGVLEQCPKLKLVLSHGGGYLPAYSGRIDHAASARPDMLRENQRDADNVSEAAVFRHAGLHASAAGVPGAAIRRGSRADGHGLSGGYGGSRSARLHRIGARPDRRGPARDPGWERGAIARPDRLDAPPVIARSAATKQSRSSSAPTVGALLERDCFVAALLAMTGEQSVQNPIASSYARRTSSGWPTETETHAAAPRWHARRQLASRARVAPSVSSARPMIGNAHTAVHLGIADDRLRLAAGRHRLQVLEEPLPHHDDAAVAAAEVLAPRSVIAPCPTQPTKSWFMMWLVIQRPVVGSVIGEYQYGIGLCTNGSRSLGTRV